MVRDCYRRRGYILMEHQDVFRIPYDEMIRTKSSQYLKAWVHMVQALELQSNRTCLEGKHLVHSEIPDDDSMATITSIDLHDYLVDVTDGMEREWDVGDQGAVQTPPRPNSGDMCDHTGEQRKGLLVKWLEKDARKKGHG